MVLQKCFWQRLQEKQYASFGFFFQLFRGLLFQEHLNKITLTNLKHLKSESNSFFKIPILHLSIQIYLVILALFAIFKSKCAKIIFSEFFLKENFLFCYLSINFHQIIFQIKKYIKLEQINRKQNNCNININRAVKKTCFTLST